MKAYSLIEFKEELQGADIVYAGISLNAAVRLPVRVRKKTLVKLLEEIPEDSWGSELTIFAETGISPKGHKTLKLV